MGSNLMPSTIAKVWWTVVKTGDVGYLHTGITGVIVEFCFKVLLEGFV